MSSQSHGPGHARRQRHKSESGHGDHAPHQKSPRRISGGLQRGDSCRRNHRCRIRTRSRRGRKRLHSRSQGQHHQRRFHRHGAGEGIRVYALKHLRTRAQGLFGNHRQTRKRPSSVPIRALISLRPSGPSRWQKTQTDEPLSTPPVLDLCPLGGCGSEAPLKRQPRTARRSRSTPP